MKWLRFIRKLKPYNIQKGLRYLQFIIYIVEAIIRTQCDGSLFAAARKVSLNCLFSGLIRVQLACRIVCGGSAVDPPVI